MTQSQHVNDTDPTHFYHKLTLPFQSESAIMCTMRIFVRRFLISERIRLFKEKRVLFCLERVIKIVYCRKTSDYMTNLGKLRQENLIK